MGTHHSIGHLLADTRSSASTKQDLSFKDVRLEGRLGTDELGAESSWNHNGIQVVG